MPMTRQEFIARQKESRKLMNRWIWWVLPGFILCFLPLVCFYLSQEIAKKSDEGLVQVWEALVSLALAVLAFGLFGLLVWLMARWNYRLMQKSGLVCCSCGKALALTATSVEIVVATGRCGGCGGIVLADDRQLTTDN